MIVVVGVKGFMVVNIDGITVAHFKGFVIISIKGLLETRLATNGDMSDMVFGRIFCNPW